MWADILPSPYSESNFERYSTDTGLFDGLYTITEIDGSDIGVPLTNGKAVARVSDGVVGLYADGGKTFVTHQPVGTDGYQGPSTVIMDSDGIAIILKDSSRQVVRIVVD